MNRPSVFRQVALNRLSSPDDIDRLLRVTSPRGWLTLIGLALVIFTSVVWAFRVTVPLTVAGEGILLKSGGLFDIVFDASGRLVDIAVGPGDLVREGQVVARMAQPELAERLHQAQIELAARNAEQERAITAGARETDLEIRYLDRRRQSLERTLAAGSDPAARDDMAQVAIQQLQVRAKRERDLRDAASRVREASEQVARLERELSIASEVRSPYTGRVIEIAAEPHAVVARGESLLTLDLTGRTVTALEAIVYVPARDGKRVKPGMPVQLAPATVRPEEYGYLLGTVTRVSDFPSTSRGMVRVLKNKELVASLSDAGAPYEVHVDLLPDHATVSRYRWSSSKGPPVEIQTGTLCSAFVVFDSRRPVEIVMPFVRTSGLRP